MKLQIARIVILSIVLFSSCSKDSERENEQEEPRPESSELYFPPLNSNAWETTTLQELNWNTDAEQPLYTFLEEKDTKAFLILKDGKIAIEKYFGTFERDSLWYWASAGKTLTSFTVGIAQENGFLNIEDKSSKYLGEGWTSATLAQENKITVRNQLTMTNGLKFNQLTFGCVQPICLEYRADAGTRWAYHNGPYTLLQSVVATATNSQWSDYYNTNLRDKIGMEGVWRSSGASNVYYSTARSMARFGLLNLNNGKWDDEVVLGDLAYLSAMKNTSQDLNKSYGYLWWLNGKESHMGTAEQQVYDGYIIPNAPVDTYAALGKNDQKLYVVPSEGLIVVRLGEDAGENKLGHSSFDNELWEKIGTLIGN